MMARNYKDNKKLYGHAPGAFRALRPDGEDEPSGQDIEAHGDNLVFLPARTDGRPPLELEPDAAASRPSPGKLLDGSRAEPPAAPGKR